MLVDGPLEMMYSWQAFLCAMACVGLTKLIKALIDISMGVEKRKATRWINTLLLPMSPIFFGALYAVAIPMRPEVLINYVKAQELSVALGYLAYAGWGAACGQFATMIHGKLVDFMLHSGPKSRA